jgi:hypothetical protein
MEYNNNISTSSILFVPTIVTEERPCEPCEPRETKIIIKRHAKSTSPNNGQMPSQMELYKMVLKLTEKCESLQRDVNNLKAMTNNRFRRNVMEYLQFTQKPTSTFLDWTHSFMVTDEDLQILFDNNLNESMKKCLGSRIENEGALNIPVRMFKEKPDWLFIYTDEPVVVSSKKKEAEKDEKDTEKDEKDTEKDEKDAEKDVEKEVEIDIGAPLLKEPVWRKVSKTEFHRIQYGIERKIMAKFLDWEEEYSKKYRYSTEKMDLAVAYALKVNNMGNISKQHKNYAEFYKWFFAKIAH